MLNILVVDDFMFDRRNLIDVISTVKEIDVNIIGECEDGKQALQFIRECKVDIVITDIDMPFMNGLELARNINISFPEIKIIFCSLYDEFDYARKAIYLNTSGYILKPINREELEKCMVKVILEIESEKVYRKSYEEMKKILQENKPQMLDSFIKEILAGNFCDQIEIKSKGEYLGIQLQNRFFGVVYIEIDDYQRIVENKTIEQKQLLTIEVYKQLGRVAGEFENHLMTKIDDSHFVYIENTLSNQDTYNRCSEFSSNVLNIFEGLDISVTISISDICPGVGEIKNLLEQCMYIMRYKFTLGGGKVLRSADIPDDTYKRDIDLNTIQKDIRFLLNSGSEKDIKKYITQLFSCNAEYIRQKEVIQICFSVITCMIVVMNENNQKTDSVFCDIHLLWKKLIEFETIKDIENWLHSILMSVSEQLLCEENTKYELILDRAREFIDQNYMESIGIDDIADQVNYSANYLSYIFKKLTGETIVDYMTHLKIMKAKEMLVDVHYKIYNISDALGFNNVAYFCSVFKKNTGMTPNEYRKRI